EAALGQEVDARTDVFAVGILMWEALAGRRLFLGDTDYETVKKVQRAEVPSLHELNSEVDAELEALFAKSMAKQRDERFQTAHDLGEAIADYLFRHRLRVTSFAIARLMQSVVVSKDDRRRKMDSSIIDQLISDELLAFTSLDDMSDPLNATAKAQSPDRPSVPRPAVGARPLDAGSFGRGEDPTAWYPDEDAPDEATSFFDRATLESGDFRAGHSDPHELAALLESDETGRNKVLAPADLGKLVESETGEADKGGAALDDLSSQRKPAVAAPGPVPVKAEKPKSGAGMYIVITLVALGVLGAAAWFGGFIPH
ncbi:MAG TPA: hypothetical protein VI299_16535, partial [Polyangiales bacterium]